MRASGGTDDPGLASAASERLTGLGLPRSSVGWVPEQPARLGQPAEDVLAGAGAPGTVAPPSGEAPAASGGPPPAHPTRQTGGPGSVGELLRTAALERAPLWAAGPIERATIGGLASAVAVVVLIVVAGVMLVHRHHAGGTTSYSSSYADAANSPAPDPVSSSVSDAASIVVDVGGRVRKPGLVTLPAGARVADAIDAAGGPLHRRELDQIDLAQRVTDGQLLLIGIAPSTSGAGEAAGSAPSDTSGPISLSTGSLEQLETLPGVGPVTAQKIIDYRTAHGGFSTVEQLQQVPGIGPAHYAEISPLVTP